MKRKTHITKKPNGHTVDERWYSLVRRYAALFAWRQTNKPRCKRCFIMRAYGDKCLPRFGYGGCAEMEIFKNECIQFLTRHGVGLKNQKQQIGQTGRKV